MMNHALALLNRGALTLAIGFALGAGTLTGRSATSLAEPLRLRSGGQAMLYEVSRDELWVQVGKRRELRPLPSAASTQSLLAEAQTLQSQSGQAVDLVLYPQGLARNRYTRALLTREVLVELAPGTDAQALARTVSLAGAQKITWTSNFWMFTTSELAGAPALAAALRAQSGVRYAEAQLAFELRPLFVPDDELFTNQWHLLNTGQKGARPGVDVEVTNVWDTYRGDGIVFAITDSGLEGTQPDLVTNVVPGLGYDFIDHDNDPSPDMTDMGNAHGTSVAGVAAGRGNNVIGVSGASPNGGIVGLRLIGGPITDADNAAAMLYEPQIVSINNNSWAWSPDYILAVGPGPLTEQALRLATSQGRGGRGVIITFASGNSRGEGGNANFNGNANSIYTFGITGSSDRGEIISYATPGSCVVVAAPTGDFSRQDITTTDTTGDTGFNPNLLAPPANYTNTDYTLTFNGTSSACPLASGVIGLILEANPNLSYRDVKEILIRTARVISPTDPMWFTNAAGFHFNYNFGAGQIVAKPAVALARTWVNLGPETNFVYAASNLSLAIPDNDTNGITYEFTATDALRMEHVTLGVDITHSHRADLEITLTSPSGTTSLLATARPYDFFADLQWTFMTVQSWGEFSPGTWRVNIRDTKGGDTGLINHLILTTYGTITDNLPITTADVGVRVASFPDPVLLGNTLTYTVSITNAGVLPATNVVVQHALPLTTVFLNATPSQGAANQIAGLVNWNAGNLVPGASASMTVRVIPTVAGTVYSSATATTTSPDINPGNNSYIVSTRVLPLNADLAVSMTDSPDPVLVGGTLNYTVSVTNRGPSSAGGVTLVANVPAGVAITSTFVTQGTTKVVGNQVTCTIGTLTSAGRATLTISTRPLAAGNLLATASVASSLPDPVSANNTASTTTAVNPASDLALALIEFPNPVVIGSNFTYSITVTNRGPNPSSSVTVNLPLPAGLSVVSSNTSQGAVTVTAGTLIATLGNLPVGGWATVTATVRAFGIGTFVATANVSAAQADSDLSNNAATVSTTVAPPFVSIVPAGATLLSESGPTNGAVDIGEWVTVNFRLRNAGNVQNTNLVATLLATNGVTNPSGPQTYGILPPGGLPVGSNFTFTATGTNGGVVNATFRLTDAGNFIGNVVFAFTLPDLAAPANPALITINDAAAATPYPSSLVVAGLTGIVSKVTVTVSNLNHTYPDDLDMLLVGPGGQKIMLMSDAGGGGLLTNTTIRFDDSGPPLPNEGQINSATYRPTDNEPGDSLPAPAPQAPYQTALASLNGAIPNGTWSLYVADDATGDKGSIANGWSLQIFTVIPVNQLADLMVVASAAPGPVLVGSPLTYTFNVTNNGPNPANGVSLTNSLPAGATFVSADSTVGIAAQQGSNVVATIGALPIGGTARVTVVVKPTTAGSLSSTATVGALEVDLNPANNLASATATAQWPVADLAVALFPPSSTNVTTGTNLSYVLTVTNLGPQNALAAVVTNRFGSTNVTVVSAVPTLGAVATNEALGALVFAPGDLLPGQEATLAVTLAYSAAGVFTNSLLAVTASTDSVTGNNAAAVVLNVTPPAPWIVLSNVVLLTESGAQNGTIEPGETVTVAFALANFGQIPTTNLVATLAASGGILNPGAPQDYGSILPGDPAVSRPFTFTAAAAGPLTATLLLSNGIAALPAVHHTFTLPLTNLFPNPAPISIPELGAARPYPSALVVSGLTGVVGQVTVTLSNLSHSFPDDVDILLVSPAGQSVVLLSDVGGNLSVSNITLTLSDSAASYLPDNGPLVSGTFRPTDYETNDVFEYPAPNPPYASTLAAFNGADPNGTWSLFVVDDSSGDAGSLAGWSLKIATFQPVNPVADLGLTLSASPQNMASWQNVAFEIFVQNHGSASAEAVVVTNLLPAGLKFVQASATQGNWTNTGAVTLFNLGPLAPGASAVLNVVANPTSAGSKTTFATVAGIGNADLVPANNSASATVTTVAPPVAPTLSATFKASVGEFVMTLTGEPNQAYEIVGSSNFTSWTSLGTITSDGTGKAIYAAPASQTFLFYRAIRNP